MPRAGLSVAGRSGAGVLVAGLLLAAATPVGGRTVADIDLSAAFGASAGWRLLATQGPDIPDPIMADGGMAPGRVRLCLRSPAGGCDPALDQRLRAPVVADDYYTEPHFLKRAAIVRPNGPAGAPLLLVQTASLFSGDGGQVNTTQVIAYRPATGRFERVFRQAVGGGTTNQEIRYIAAGRLRGAVIAAEPASHAPFGYWVTVNRLTPAGGYRPALRFLSATRYGDGNPLAVIDAEMPGIERRLGLWRPGQPWPLPVGGCPRPHLARGALWCR